MPQTQNCVNSSSQDKIICDGVNSVRSKNLHTKNVLKEEVNRMVIKEELNKSPEAPELVPFTEDRGYTLRVRKKLDVFGPPVLLPEIFPQLSLIPKAHMLPEVIVTRLEDTQFDFKLHLNQGGENTSLSLTGFRGFKPKDIKESQLAFNHIFLQRLTIPINIKGSEVSVVPVMDEIKQDDWQILQMLKGIASKAENSHKLSQADLQRQMIQKLQNKNKFQDIRMPRLTSTCAIRLPPPVQISQPVIPKECEFHIHRAVDSKLEASSHENTSDITVNSINKKEFKELKCDEDIYRCPSPLSGDECEPISEILPNGNTKHAMEAYEMEKTREFVDFQAKVASLKKTRDITKIKSNWRTKLKTCSTKQIRDISICDEDVRNFDSPFDSELTDTDKIIKSVNTSENTLFYEKSNVGYDSDDLPEQEDLQNSPAPVKQCLYHSSSDDDLWGLPFVKEVSTKEVTEIKYKVSNLNKSTQELLTSKECKVLQDKNPVLLSEIEPGTGSWTGLPKVVYMIQGKPLDSDPFEKVFGVVLAPYKEEIDESSALIPGETCEYLNTFEIKATVLKKDGPFTFHVEKKTDVELFDLIGSKITKVPGNTMNGPTLKEIRVECKFSFKGSQFTNLDTQNALTWNKCECFLRVQNGKVVFQSNNVNVNTPSNEKHDVKCEELSSAPCLDEEIKSSLFQIKDHGPFSQVKQMTQNDTPRSSWSSSNSSWEGSPERGRKNSPTHTVMFKNFEEQIQDHQTVIPSNKVSSVSEDSEINDRQIWRINSQSVTKHINMFHLKTLKNFNFIQGPVPVKLVPSMTYLGFITMMYNQNKQELQFNHIGLPKNECFKTIKGANIWLNKFLKDKMVLIPSYIEVKWLLFDTSSSVLKLYRPFNHRLLDSNNILSRTGFHRVAKPEHVKTCADLQFITHDYSTTQTNITDAFKDLSNLYTSTGSEGHFHRRMLMRFALRKSAVLLLKRREYARIVKCGESKTEELKKWYTDEITKITSKKQVINIDSKEDSVSRDSGFKYTMRYKEKCSGTFCYESDTDEFLSDDELGSSTNQYKLDNADAMKTETKPTELDDDCVTISVVTKVHSLKLTRPI
ncbi:unnamed protein product [Timema podura]|uniref:Uncharacterized protein n=1 Tax=Timema podura TaxID=61482 RepID=A0ABN7NM85_TIMPD|nr:unnamed protein product [Timema podura]